MSTVVFVIFGLTYALIALRRLRVLPIGRAAGAMLGATLMLVVGAISPDEAYRAVDHDTLVLLFGMMVITARLADAGFFDVASAAILRVTRTPVRLLVAVSLLSGGMSAFMVNDTVCLFLTPIVVATCARVGLPMGPYLLAVATSANLGSAATLVGNPQNMLIGSMSGLSFVDFLAHAGPAAALALLLNTGLLLAYYGRTVGRVTTVPPPKAAPARTRELALPLATLASVVLAFFLGAHLGVATLAGAAFLVATHRRDATATFARVDWPLLVFFAGLFVVVAALRGTGVVEDAFAWAAPGLGLDDAGGVAGFTVFTALGSNVVSNVPMVLLTGPYLPVLGPPELGWVLLGYVTTVAGNLTLVGSVANIIVAERAAADYELGFFEYLRFGAVSTALALAVGVPLIVLGFP
ncbi:MAG: hypothetical protein EP329_05670 [Deltaproteobacteria bacterium]|nr:MAG: hypothetical protein EP329_05670 [Deltaproteobacteria bacterium]